MNDPDYAAKLAEKWETKMRKHNGLLGAPPSRQDAIEGAIREALAKATEVPEGLECRGVGCTDRACHLASVIAGRIRALGAKP